MGRKTVQFPVCLVDEAVSESSQMAALSSLCDQWVGLPTIPRATSTCIWDGQFLYVSWREKRDKPDSYTIYIGTNWPLTMDTQFQTNKASLIGYARKFG